MHGTTLHRGVILSATLLFIGTIGMQAQQPPGHQRPYHCLRNAGTLVPEPRILSPRQFRKLHRTGS